MRTERGQKRVKAHAGVKPAGLTHSGLGMAGFSMVEAMVAVLVVSIGLLGLAKIQALALASTGTAKTGALASIEAASLASTMRADRAYWAGITANLTVAVASDGTITATDRALNAPTSMCTSTTAVCTSTQIAALDLSNWAMALVGTLPPTPAVPSTITCLYDATRQNPVGCNIVLNWTENLVASNTSDNAAATARQNASALPDITQTTYTLYVDP